MERKCSFCGCTYETFSFKHGYVCDGCLQYVKSIGQPDSQKRDKDQSAAKAKATKAEAKAKAEAADEDKD